MSTRMARAEGRRTSKVCCSARRGMLRGGCLLLSVCLLRAGHTDRTQQQQLLQLLLLCHVSHLLILHIIGAHTMPVGSSNCLTQCRKFYVDFFLLFFFKHGQYLRDCYGKISYNRFKIVLISIYTEQRSWFYEISRQQWATYKTQKLTLLQFLQN